MNALRNGRYGTALVLAAAALGGCGQVANVPRPGVDYMVQATMSADCSFQLDELEAGGKQWFMVQPQPPGKVSMCNAIDNF